MASPNGAGNTKWGDSNIASILKNEKYIGNALLHKSYTIYFLTKKRIRNQGIMPQHYIKDDHEAIIPKSSSAGCKKKENAVGQESRFHVVKGSTTITAPAFP